MKIKLFFLTLLMVNFLTNAQTTAIPDVNFEQALIDLGHDTAPTNGSVPTANINTITDLDVTNKNIADLTGIEDFVGLLNLTCDENPLSALNLASNSELGSLRCRNTNITMLDLSNNTKMKFLFCNDNKLTNLNISSCTILEWLECFNNELTSLNIGNKQELRSVRASSNKITSINTDQAPKLAQFGIADNLLTDLDISQNPLLENISCGLNNISVLNTDLNTKLTQIVCFDNQLENLDVSKNTQLERFNARNNKLTSLNFKNGNNTNIIQFITTGNSNLACIVVDDKNYSAANWTNIDSHTNFGNTEAECNAFSARTIIPDSNFEKALIALGHDDVEDGGVLTSNINSLTSLDVSGKNISSLEGIEDFIALTFLKCNGNNLTNLVSPVGIVELLCYSNKLTSINLSNSKDLERIQSQGNELTSFDVSSNEKLENLRCDNNMITSLDVNQNINLEYLLCGGNQLGSLDISNNQILIRVDASHNLLTSLILSQNANSTLVDLSCHHNELTSLDASNYKELKTLLCYTNNLTSLNLQTGNNTNMGTGGFSSTINPNLVCIFVDDAAWSDANWAQKDDTSYFVNDQAGCDNVLAIEDFEIAEFKLYPNPVQDQLTITGKNMIVNEVRVFDHTGRMIRNINWKGNSTNLNSLAPGMYIIRVKTDQGTTARKMLKI